MLVDHSGSNDAIIYSVNIDLLPFWNIDGESERVKVALIPIGNLTKLYSVYTIHLSK